MAGSRRTTLEIAGTREASALAANLARIVREARRAKNWRQVDLGRRVGMSQSEISKIERNLGGRMPLDSWVSLGLALDRPLHVDFSKPLAPPRQPADAGHLAAQEFLMKLLTGHGWRTDFELPTRPQNPAHSIDVAARDDRARRLLILEIWNSMGDLGAAARSSARKLADAAEMAVAIGHGEPYEVALAWLIRPTAANRELLRTYPTILRSRFPGSSAGWVEALTTGTAPPTRPGLLWIDPAAGRLVPIRLGAA